MNTPRIVVGGVTSGVGKTTIVAGLIAALKRRGLRVQPFKCGPDYIDPSYHSLAAGLPCRNLDSWMLPRNAMVDIFGRACRDADVAVVEGVMGLYDGRSGMEDSGSTAEIARWLSAPVVLVVDVGKTARSAAATVLGFRRFDPELNLAGVILNYVGGPSHLQWTKEAIESGAGVPVLGYLPKKAEIELPERHLGLVPTLESDDLALAVHAIRVQVERTVDFDSLLEVARTAGPLPEVEKAGLFPEVNAPRVNMAVGRDEAFNFYYQDNLDLLEAWGAHLTFVSPLHDKALPEDAHGFYLGGGFPELFARELAANSAFRASLAGAVAGGMPVYAECGGLMYICEGIVDLEGEKHPMAGLVPGWSVMQQRCVRMGYVVAEALQDSIIAPRGRQVRGHEFHWSTLSGAGEGNAYHTLEPEEGFEGFVTGPRGNVLGSYLHLHFGSDPSLANRFVECCAAYAGSSFARGLWA